MKKIISLVLLLSLVFLFSTFQTIFANDTMVREETINGEKFIIKKMYVEGKLTVTVENDDSIFKATYDRDGNVIINKVEKTRGFKNMNTQEEQFVTKIELSNEETDINTPFSNYSTYISKYFKGYKYAIMRATTTGRVFDLSIPKDSLRTLVVSSGDKVYNLSYDFYYTLVSADDYTESAILAGYGFLPGAGTIVSIGTIIENISQEKMTISNYIAAFIAAVEMVPGLGTIVNMADFAANSALSMAELYNVRTIFRNVKSYI